MVGLPIGASASGPTAKEAGPDHEGSDRHPLRHLGGGARRRGAGLRNKRQGCNQEAETRGQEGDVGSQAGPTRAPHLRSRKRPTPRQNAASPSETTGSRRRTATKKTAARKATVAKSATTKAPPKKSTTRKAVATAPATSGTTAKPGTATTGGSIEGSGDTNGLEERERKRERREDEEGCRQEGQPGTGAAPEAGQRRSPGPVRQDPRLGSVSRDAGRRRRQDVGGGDRCVQGPSQLTEVTEQASAVADEAPSGSAVRFWAR